MSLKSRFALIFTQIQNGWFEKAIFFFVYKSSRKKVCFFFFFFLILSLFFFLPDPIWILWAKKKKTVEQWTMQKNIKDLFLIYTRKNRTVFVELVVGYKERTRLNDCYTEQHCNRQWQGRQGGQWEWPAVTCEC